MAITSVESINDQGAKESLSEKLNDISLKLRSSHSQHEKFDVLREALIFNGDSIRPMLNACIFEYLVEVNAFLSNRHRRKSLCLIYNKLLEAHKDFEIKNERNDTEVLLVRLLK